MMPETMGKVLAALLVLWWESAAGERTLTIVNDCAFDVWPAVQGANALPLDGGWHQPAGHRRSVQVPENWEAARVWERTGCEERGGGLHCATGDCAGRLACGGAGGRTPVSLAEFTFSGADGLDWYDVSLVDGFNLPIALKPSAGQCTRIGCTKDLLPSCPSELQTRSGGSVVGCKSACERYGTDAYCCRGANAGGPQACPPSDLSRLFKAACPKAYSYAYDDQSSLFTCPSRHQADYEVVFCPGGGAGPGDDRPASSFACSRWGWRFMDGFDIYGNDLRRVAAGQRSECQPACRGDAGCRAYAWADGWCYLKSAGDRATRKAGVYSAIIC